MDRDKTYQFLEQVTAWAAGATTIGLLALADRTGLLRAMADGVSGTTADIADTTGLDARYVTEILGGLHAAAIVEWDPTTGSFSLSPEHAAVIGDDASPYAMTGWLDMIPSAFEHTDAIAEAVRTGGGVDFDAFGPKMVRGIDRANRPSHTILLARRWLTHLPDITERLASGGVVADIGCGSGAAVEALARAFPAASVVGVDRSVASIERAVAGSSMPNVRYVVGTTSDLPAYGPFDLVTMLDVVHDLVDPVGSLTTVRRSLTDGGAVFVLEPSMPEDMADRVGPHASLVYGISVFHCLTQSLAAGGAGLGAAGGESAIRSVAEQAGFTSVEVLPIDNPFSSFYRLS
ncbi:MAG: methyltransferase domain-containing protein [Acidimicrobiia bacterium]|nr:methyltransferase domain-containing protein [Acidimicrobiia bacterium]